MGSNLTWYSSSSCIQFFCFISSQGRHYLQCDSPAGPAGLCRLRSQSIRRPSSQSASRRDNGDGIALISPVYSTHTATRHRPHRGEPDTTTAAVTEKAVPETASTARLSLRGAHDTTMTGRPPVEVYHQVNQQRLQGQKQQLAVAAAAAAVAATAAAAEAPAAAAEAEATAAAALATAFTSRNSKKHKTFV